MRSLARVAAIASNTLLGLARERVFWFLLVFALLLIASSVVLVRFSFQDQFQMLKDVSLGAMSVFSSLLAVLATASLLPRDLEERTLYTLLAKPVGRGEYLVGKFLGVALLLTLALALMGALFFALLFVRGRAVEAETARDLAALAPDALASKLAEMRAVVRDPNLVAAGALILAKACVLAAATLCLSTFATSNLFTVMLAAAVWFIGHLQGAAREYWQGGGEAVGAWTKLTLGATSVIFPDFQLFNLVDEVAAGIPVPIVLLARTLGLGAFYVAIYLGAAHFVFLRKEL